MTILAHTSAMSPKQRFPVMLEGSTLDALRAIQSEHGITPSEQIRRALQEWIAKQGVKKTARKRVAARKRA